MLIPGWPRSRSTMAMFTGRRFMGKPFAANAQYFRYTWTGVVERLEPEFRYTIEDALEKQYRDGQNAMIDRFRAEYRTLTDEDSYWLCTTWADDSLRAAIKQAFREKIQECPKIPIELILTIKTCADNDAPFWHRWRLTSLKTDNSVLFA